MAQSVSSGASEGLPPLIGGKYKPVRIIGSGGMGTVYEVEHLDTGEHLALKELKGDAWDHDPAAIERFRREARVASQVKSEHIVRVIDAGRASERAGAPYLVMDLLEGADLGRATDREPQLASLVVDWLGQVARALDKMHALGIVHRDLKPENLFLCSEAQGRALVKILDFGIAKFWKEGDQIRTASGAVLGSPLYMAPEQVQATEIRPATDMWALGLIAYRLLCAENYWLSSNISMLYLAILQEPLKAPSGRKPRLFDERFDTWFFRSCHRDATQRWPSVSAQIDALAEALAVPYPGRTSDPSLADTFPHTPRRGSEYPPISGRVPTHRAEQRRPASRLWLAAPAVLLALIGYAAWAKPSAPNAALLTTPTAALLTTPTAALLTTPTAALRPPEPPPLAPSLPAPSAAEPNLAVPSAPAVGSKASEPSSLASAVKAPQRPSALAKSGAPSHSATPTSAAAKPARAKLDPLADPM